jgi:hypothetical protein
MSGLDEYPAYHGKHGGWELRISPLDRANWYLPIHLGRCYAASPTFTAIRPGFQEQMMKGQEGKKTAKKEPAKTMKEKKAAKKVKKEEKSRQ